MSDGKRLCLNMVVHNAIANLPRCLAALAEHVACWVVCDIGSTDGSQDFIRYFFASRDLPGQLHDIPFRDFGQARNAALNYAYASPFAYEYLLLNDGDLELVVEDRSFRQRLERPAYRIVQRTGSGVVSWHPRLLRRDLGVRYRGIAHAFLDTTSAPEKLERVWCKELAANGANRLDKSERDARLLLEGLQRDPENRRYWYYLAGSYREVGRTREAVVAYARRAEMGGQDEEAWSARLEQARGMRALGDSDSFVRLALAAFDERPTRAEPLYDLARFYRETGMNDASLLFSEAGVAIKQPDDALAVEETVYTSGLQEEYAVSGFYARDPKHRARGFAACNWLSLNRAIGDRRRKRARSNLIFYLPPAAAVMPSFAPWQIAFTPPDDRHPMNPSVARVGDQIVLAMRAVNYTLSEDGLRFQTKDEVPISTRNFLLRLDNNLVTYSAQEILPPTDFPEPLGKRAFGFEDLRLFEWHEQLWASACLGELTPEGWCEQVMARIEDSSPGECRLTDWRVLHPTGERRDEKNWMPRVVPERANPSRAKCQFVYLCDPTRIVDDHAQIVGAHTPRVAALQFRGGTQAISFRGGWLALIHEAMWSRSQNRRLYWHRFVWFDRADELRGVSRPFFFNKKGVEFAAGLTLLPDRKCLLVSYGVADREAWMARVDADEVAALLEDVDDIASAASGTGKAVRFESET
jgi:predicted GH43/DUF377 family glycosyl hydrolase/tetratricopeptide (TPR) repeat protein